MAAFAREEMEDDVKVKKGLEILWARLTQQGIRTTFLWALDHLVRRISGAPVEHVSRITPLLHVGGQYTKRGWKQLRERGVGAVVNMRIEYDDKVEGIAPEMYLYLPTVDDTPPTFEYLEQGASFIRDCINQGVGVYIHCKSGIGRAPSVAIAYLLSTGLSYEEALAVIKAKRPFIRLTQAQKEQLEKYAASLTVKASEGE
ncbi:MAG: dual specificity protein phosphatase family protein [Anaerolineales bacterium]|nr:dual specificity protein phosphatase family protein [Anaerolineales bacterium]